MAILECKAEAPCRSVDLSLDRRILDGQAVLAASHLLLFVHDKRSDHCRPMTDRVRGAYVPVSGIDGKTYDAACGIACVPVSIACEHEGNEATASHRGAATICPSRAS
jgi:hypothetical protein